MIQVVGRELRIPKGEENIGVVGDSKVEAREFAITEEALFDFDFKLDLKLKSNINIVDLEKMIEPGRIILRWEIRKEHIPEKGILFVQLRAFKAETEEIWHSGKYFFWVNGCIDAVAHFTSPLPSEFEQMEQQVTAARNEVFSAKDVVLEKAGEVTVTAQLVAENTTAVAQKADEVQNAADIVSTNTMKTENAADIANQSLTDLLTMMGTDIATLVNGKLASSQLPDLSINDVFEVENEGEILALNAQRGDMALVISNGVVQDSYILASDTPHKTEDWKKLGISFTPIAGHAMYADNADNASKINNHRLVFMTESQYANAAIDNDVLYAVFPDEEE